MLSASSAKSTPLLGFLRLPTKYSRCHIIGLASSAPKTLYGRENAFEQGGRWHAGPSLTKALEPLDTEFFVFRIKCLHDSVRAKEHGIALFQD